MLYMRSGVPGSIPFIEINADKVDEYENIYEAKEPMAEESPYTTEEAIELILSE